MAEADDGAPKTESAENPRSDERREVEVASIINATILTEHRKRLVGPEGKPKSPQSTEDHAVLISHAILVGQNSGDRPFRIGFPKATGDGHDILMPDLKREDRGGMIREFEEGELRLAGINGVTPDGRLLCYFEDQDGNAVEDSGGADESGSNAFQFALTREEVLGLQVRSEMDTYSGFFTGPNQEVFQAAMGNRDIDESLDPAIEAAARANGLFTADQIRSLVDHAAPDADKRPPEIQQLLQSLDGKIILTREDFQKTVTTLGGPDALKNRADAISTEIAQLRKTLESDKDNAIAKQQLAELQAEQSALGTAYNLFTKAHEEGKTPFDNYFDMAQNGELTDDQRNVLGAFLAGDTKPFAEYLQKMENLTETERNKLLEYGLKGGKGSLWILAILLAIPAAVAASTVYMTATGAAAGGGRR